MHQKKTKCVKKTKKKKLNAPKGKMHQNKTNCIKRLNESKED